MILAKKVSAGTLTQVCEGPCDIKQINLLTVGAAITECSLYDACAYNSPSNPMINLVSNGDLASTVTTEFGALTNWAQSGATLVHTAGATTALSQNLGEASGDLYTVVFTIASVSAGSVTPSIGGVAGTARTTAATFTEVFRATGTTNFELTPSNDFAGAVSNIIVYKLGDATDIVRNDKLATVAETKAIDLSDSLHMKYGCMCFVTGTNGEAWIYIE